MITELIKANPITSLIVISALVTFFMTFLTWLVTDKEKMRELRERQKELQRKAKEHQKNGNQDALLEINKQMMMEMPEMMKHNLKPMLITFIPAVVIFSFLNGVYRQTSLGGWWILCYIIFSLISSVIFRKVFKMP